MVHLLQFIDYISIETVSCHLTLQMARMENGWKLEKVGFKINTMPSKICEKYHGFCSLMKFFQYLYHNGIRKCVKVKSI